MRTQYEADDVTFNADAYREARHPGIAWHILGWEVQPDEDTEWTGQLIRTGQVVAMMVGDDRHFTFDQSELIPIERAAYCGVCGQIGCGHDGYDRE